MHLTIVILKFSDKISYKKIPQKQYFYNILNHRILRDALKNVFYILNF